MLGRNVRSRKAHTSWIGVLTVLALISTPLSAAPALAAETGVVSVLDFGAKGDGVSEDTAAFQAAIDAAAGKTLSIPAGTYVLGSVNVTKPVNIVGAGMTSTLIEAKAGLDKEMFIVKDTSNVDFSDFEIDGNRSTYTTGHTSGIRYLRASDGLVQRVNIHDFMRTGVDVYEGSTRITVRDSFFAHNENDVLFHKSTYNRAINNVGEYARTESFASYEEAYGPQVSGHNYFAYNKSYHAETGLSFQRSHWNYAHDNYVEDAQWGLVIVGLRDPVNQNTYENVAANNTFVGGPRSTGTGILTDDRTRDATITGNVVRDWPLGTMGPVRLQGRHTVFTGNRVENAGQQVEISADDTVFTGNTISRSGKVGLLITRDVRSVRIENNVIEYSGDVGMQTLAAVRDSAIVGNTFHSNRTTVAAGAGIWANAESVWTNTVFANNRMYDDQEAVKQGGVHLRSGSTLAVSGNSISGTSTWPSAAAGTVVDIGARASDGHARWQCTTSGQPGTWSATDAAVVPQPAPGPTPQPAPAPTPSEPVVTSPGTATASPAPGTTGRGRKVKRLAGADRYATAVTISADSFATADSVVLATGGEYPDALAASSLAGALRAPLLLTQATAVREDVLAEIARLRATKVVIVGGAPAVSPGVEATLKSRGLKVERVAGASRYATSAEVARRVAGTTRGGTVFIARGDDFADALSVSPIAYGKRFPVLLTRPAGLPAETLAALQELAPSRIVIVGSTVAVGAKVEEDLKALSPSVRRISGSTRYGTSAAIARYALAQGWASGAGVGIAAGDRFPDALGGGAACGNAGGLLLLTPPPALSGETRTLLGEVMTDSTEIDLYGGVSAVLPAVETDVRALAL